MDDDNVIEFRAPKTNGTDEDLDPNIILEGAKDVLTSVLLVGYTKDGSLYLALSQGDAGDNLVLVEAAKAVIVDHIMEALE